MLSVSLRAFLFLLKDKAVGLVVFEGSPASSLSLLPLSPNTIFLLLSLLLAFNLHVTIQSLTNSVSINLIGPRINASRTTSPTY